MNKCRACLCDDALQLFDWNSTIVDLCDMTMTYAECFTSCTNLEVHLDDSMPQQLCFHCASELKDAFDFIQKSRQTDSELRSKQITAAEDFEWETTKISPAEKYEMEMFKYTVDDSLIEHFLEPSESNDLQSQEAETLTEEKPERLRRRCRANAAIKETKQQSSIQHDTEPEDVSSRYCNDNVAKEKTGLKIASDTQSKTLLCHACPRTFKYASSLRQHALTHESNRTRNYNCEICNQKFYTQSAYRTHGRTHDANRQPLFQCDECEKSFFHKGSLTLHKQQHSGKTIECKICSKRYVRASDLNVHLRTHSNDTPYQCSLCDKAFNQAGILNKHLRHHQGFRYKCDICSKEYTHQSTLIQHRKEHTGIPFKCKICGKGFVKKSKMRRHIGGVHKVKEVEEIDKLIIKVVTKKDFRGRAQNGFTT